MIQGFKAFLMRGNVLDLAVAVVIGTAFTAVIGAIVKGVITPLIAAIFGDPDLTAVGVFTVNGAEFSIGLVLDALINFLLVAAAVYFVIVLPVQKLQERRARGQEPVDEAPPEDIELLREIRDLLASQSRQP
jgi:large conductance mechanosensitive channel